MASSIFVSSLVLALAASAHGRPLEAASKGPASGLVAGYRRERADSTVSRDVLAALRSNALKSPRLARRLSDQSIRLGSSSPLSLLKSPKPFVYTLNDANKGAIEVLSYDGSLDKTKVLQNLKDAGFDTELLESKASLAMNEIVEEPIPTPIASQPPPLAAGSTSPQVVALATSFGASLAMLFIVSAALYTRALMRHAMLTQLEAEKVSLVDELKMPMPTTEKSALGDMKQAQLGLGLGLSFPIEKQPIIAYDAPPAYDDSVPTSLINLPVLMPEPISTSPEIVLPSPPIDALSVPLPPSPLLRPRRSSLNLGLRSLGGFSSSQLAPVAVSFASPSASPRLIDSSPRLVAPEIEIEAPTPVAITFPSAPTAAPVSPSPKHLSVSEDTLEEEELHEDPPTPRLPGALDLSLPSPPTHLPTHMPSTGTGTGMTTNDVGQAFMRTLNVVDVADPAWLIKVLVVLLGWAFASRVEDLESGRTRRKKANEVGGRMNERRRERALVAA